MTEPADMEQADLKPVFAKRGLNKRRGPMLSRADRSPVGLWFWEIDRVLLLLMSILIAVGLVAVAAASPVSAQKLSSGAVKLDPLTFFYRQIIWVAPWMC